MFRASVILILLVSLAAFSYQNFLSQESNLNYNAEIQEHEGNGHGDSTLFWAGFSLGLGIFQNVTHKKECLSILPVIHDDWVQINDRIKNITDFKDMIEAFKFIAQKLDDINKKCDEVRPDCKIMRDDIRKAWMNVRKYLEGPETIKKIYSHFFQNLGTVIQKWQNIGDYCKIKDWYRAGFSFGDLVRFIFIWDYQPPKEQSHDLKLFEDNYFNRPPFNFQ